MKTIMIGLCGGTFGGPSVGKKEATDILVRQHGFHEVRFISVIEEVARRTANWSGSMDEQGLKLLNRLCIGGRRINEHYWLNLAIANLPKDKAKLVFSDVFFSNEATFIQSTGGKVVRLEKPGVPACPYDFQPCQIIENSGEVALLDGLKTCVEHLEFAFSLSNEVKDENRHPDSPVS